MNSTALAVALLLCITTVHVGAFPFALDKLIVYLDTENGGQLEVGLFCQSETTTSPIQRFPALKKVGDLFISSDPVPVIDMDLMYGEVHECVFVEFDHEDTDYDAYDHNTVAEIDIIGTFTLSQANFDSEGIAVIIRDTFQAIFYNKEHEN